MPRLPHSHLFDCNWNPLINFFRFRVTDPIRNLCFLLGDISHRLTSFHVSMTNLFLFLDLHQSEFQDSNTSLPCYVSGLPIMLRRRPPFDVTGISFIEQPPSSPVCSPHTAAYSSLGDSFISRYNHHASSVPVPPFQRADTTVPIHVCPLRLLLFFCPHCRKRSHSRLWSRQ